MATHTEHQLLRILPTAGKQAGVFVSHLNRAMARFAITSPVRMAAFVAQVGHESAHLTRVVENLSYSAQRAWPRYGILVMPRRTHAAATCAQTRGHWHPGRWQIRSPATHNSSPTTPTLIATATVQLPAATAGDIGEGGFCRSQGEVTIALSASSLVNRWRHNRSYQSNRNSQRSPPPGGGLTRGLMLWLIRLVWKT